MKKKITMLAMMLCIAMLSVSVKAAGTSFTLAATTYPVTEVATMAAEISGSVAIEQIAMFSTTTNTVTEVSIYSNCDSTTTATLVWKTLISAQAEASNPTVESRSLAYTNYNMPLYLTNPCFRKSSANTTVRINGFYR